MKPFNLFFIISCLAVSATTHAESLGTYGRTYPIKERDGIQSIKDAAQKRMAELGGPKAIAKGAVERYLARLNNIETPNGITTAKANAVRHVDLTATLQYPLVGEKNKIIVPSGTRINPLKTMPLTKKFFFIDAKDQRQLAMVRQRSAPNDTVIVLGGSVLTASKVLGRQAYLDIRDFSRLMKIRYLPSIASQDGELLKVEEVSL